MIELVAVAAAGGYSVLVAAGEVFADDERGAQYRQAEILRALSRMMVARVTRVRPGDGQRINAWLAKNAGTTDLPEEEKLFFRTQLELATKEVDGR